jgi:hypothetical protein
VRTLVLVLGCRAAPYPELIRAIKETWASVVVEDVEVLFYYGGAEFAIDGSDVYLPVPDDLPHIGHKTIACFQYALASREFDLIFRTNCSSYVDLANMQAYVRSRGARRSFYAGKGTVHGKVPFASGSGYFLSRDLVELVVEKASEWDHSVLDDLALAQLMHAHGVPLQEAPRTDYLWREAATVIDTSQFHFRCKTAPTGSPSRADDIAIMKRVHRAFRKGRRRSLRVSFRVPPLSPARRRAR